MILATVVRVADMYCRQTTEHVVDDFYATLLKGDWLPKLQLTPPSRIEAARTAVQEPRTAVKGEPPYYMYEDEDGSGLYRVGKRGTNGRHRFWGPATEANALEFTDYMNRLVKGLSW